MTRVGVPAAIADPAGIIRALALDHRDSLRALLGPDQADADPIRRWKADLVRTASGRASAVMLDPEFGMHRVVLSNLEEGLGVIAAREAQGYLADDSVTHTTLLEGWSSGRAATLGAHAMKFLALWDGAENLAQSETIQRAIEEAHAARMPILLEPLPRRLPPSGPWVIDWVEVHGSAGADLLKLPHPGSADGCSEITKRVGVPWVILSAGADFDTFVHQTEDAVSAGASGYIAGRSIWREAATLVADERQRAIDRFVIPRLDRLSQIVP